MKSRVFKFKNYFIFLKKLLLIAIYFSISSL